MANVLKSPSHVANIGYNGFPMQQYLKFSSTVGELLPVYYDLLYPGDKVSGHVEHRTRTMPLETAAMCHVEEHFDWFAVPLDQIFSLSSAMLTGVKDLHSSLIQNEIENREVSELKLPFVSPVEFTHAFDGMRGAEDTYFKHDGNPDNRYLRGTNLRLLELLGVPLSEYDPVSPDMQTPNNGYPLALSVMWLAAYQKIYFDYFRLSDRELNDPSYYNFDLYTRNSQIDRFAFRKICSLRYRAAGSDFMTHNYISPLFGMASDQGYGTEFGDNMIVGRMFNQWLAPALVNSRGVELGPGVDALDPTVMNTGYNDVNPTTVTNDAGFLDALSPAGIATTFAARKFLEITRRSAKHLDAQTLAHFGVKVDKRIAGEVIHLAHSASTIVIGDVISTAQTAEGALGQVGGKGYNVAKSGRFSYENKEACPVILMCIYSAAPVYDYRQIGIDKLTTLIDPADMFRPEFDNLGMQPFFEFQARMHFSSSQSDNYGLIGWQYRWMELKCKQNRVCGALARSLCNWTTFKDNVSASLRSRLVSPFDLDSIMVKSYDFDASKNNSTLWALDYPALPDDPNVVRDPFDSDPLIHECYFDVKKASKMSAYGLESL